ncbi:hypothetical protein AAMO2058_000528600 [Amorphochlora amoebiformis]
MTSTFDAKGAVTEANLRVVIVTACFHVVDGVTVTLRKLIRSVKRRGGRVLVLTAPPPGGIKEEGTEHVDSVPLLSCCTGQNDYRIGWRLGPECEEKLRAFNPHVVHISTPDFACYAARVWADKNGVPSIATWHSNIHEYLNHWGITGSLIRPLVLSYLQSFYWNIRHTYVPMEPLRQRMVKEGFENSECGNTLKVWGRGVDTNLFHPSKRSDAFRLRHGIKEDDVVVLWVGRCVVEKRPDVYVQVMKHLEERYPGKVKGMIAGRGLYYNEMCRLPNCVGIGWQSASELPRVYASADILCFPSRVETFGNVTLEGMASGIPVVAADCCSGHLVESGFNGYAIKGIDCSGYQEAIGTLVTDRKLRMEMGMNGRKRAVRDYGVDAVMGQMVKNYIDSANGVPFQPKSKLVGLYVGLCQILVYGPYMTAHYVGGLGPLEWVGICFVLGVLVIYVYGGDSDDSDNSYSWLIGVGLATGAQLSGAIAKVLFKYYWKVKTKWNQVLISATAYVCIIVLNPVMGLMAYSFAAQSLLAPLSILNLVWNAILATLVLGEELTKANMVAYVLICSGCLLSSYFGIHKHESFTYDELMSLFRAPLFLIFMTVEIIIGIFAAYVSYSGERLYPPWVVRIAFGCLGGMMGGNQFLSKSLSELISTALRDDIHILFSVGSVCLIAGTVAVLLSGLRVLQKGLKYYTAMSLVPIYQGFFTITMVASALVFFREYELFTVKMAQAYSFALLLIFSGISQMQPPETDPDAEKRGAHMA